MQKRHNSIANALELCLFYIKPAPRLWWHLGVYGVWTHNPVSWDPSGAFTLIRVRVLHRVRFLKSRCISSKKCLHWAESTSIIRVRVRYLNKIHRLYMASASIRFFMKDADAVKDADAD